MAISGDDWSQVFDGDETSILSNVDDALASLDSGIITTWNGARFDLPFIRDRADVLGIELGLVLEADLRSRSRHDPLPGHLGGYLATWHGHGHLDAYQVYRADVGAIVRLPCGLKNLARFVGMEPVEVDRELIHELAIDELHAYVASDAIATRELALRRWETAHRHIDLL